MLRTAARRRRREERESVRRHRLGAAAIAYTAMAATLVPAAPASELIARNATNVRVQADAQGRALVSFRSEGRSRQLLAWGATDARPPRQTQPQVAFRLQ
jgi:hypothetical protein